MWRKIVNRDELKEKAAKLRGEGLSYREISKELGVSPSTIKRWLKPTRGEHVVFSGEDLSEVVGKLNDIETKLAQLQDTIANLNNKFNLMAQKLTAIEWVGVMKINPGSSRICTYVDEEGYCKRHNFGLKGFKTKEGDGKSMIHVRTYPGVCAVCPYYTPKQG